MICKQEIVQRDDGMKRVIQIVCILALLIIPNDVIYAAGESPENGGEKSHSNQSTLNSTDIEGFESLLKIYEEKGMQEDANALRAYLKSVNNLSTDNGIQSISPQSVFDWFYMIDSYQQGLAENTTGSVYVAQVMFGYAVEHWATVRSRIGNYEVKIKHLEMRARAWNTSFTQIYNITFGFDNASDVWCRRPDAPLSGSARSDATFTFATAGPTTLWAGGNY